MRIRANAKIMNIQLVEKAIIELAKKIEDTKSELEKVGILFRDGARQILSNEVAKSDYHGKNVTDELENSINYVVDIDNWRVTIGPDGSARNINGQPYDYWVEEGHFMTGWGKKGTPGAAKSPIWWPGYHYMRRSYEDNKEKVKDIFKVKLQRNI